MSPKYVSRFTDAGSIDATTAMGMMCVAFNTEERQMVYAPMLDRLISSHLAKISIYCFSYCMNRFAALLHGGSSIQCRMHVQACRLRFWLRMRIYWTGLPAQVHTIRHQLLHHPIACYTAMASMNVQVSRGPVLRCFSGHQLAAGARGCVRQGRRLSVIRVCSKSPSAKNFSYFCSTAPHVAVPCP